MKGNYEKNLQNAVEIGKKKAIKDKMNYLEVRCLHKDWGY